jgi:UDP-N-acetylmuramate--alanine ligase
VAVLTSAEYDHPDFFKSPEDMIDSFRLFLDMLDLSDFGGGILFACIDDDIGKRLADKRQAAGRTVFTYGLRDGAFCRVVNIRTGNDGYTAFDIEYSDNFCVPARITLPGIHNAKNAVAAFMATQGIVGPPFERIVDLFADFQGTGRRFELRGEINGIAVIDDYAHHPTAIKVTLEAARQRYPDRALWAVWQPHTYSRTQALMNDYVHAFDSADHVLITDIYAARENPIPGVTSAAVVAQMKHLDACHLPTFDDIVTVLDQEVKAPAVILIMSAGDAPAIGVEVLKRRQERHANPAG